MKVSVLQIVNGALRTILKRLVKGLEDLEIRGQVKNIQTTALLIEIEWEKMTSCEDEKFSSRFCEGMKRLKKAEEHISRNNKDEDNSQNILCDKNNNIFVKLDVNLKKSGGK